MGKAKFNLSAADAFTAAVEDVQEPQETVDQVGAPAADPAPVVPAVQLPKRKRQKPELKSKQLHLLVQPSVYDRLKMAADAEYMSFNEYINQILIAAAAQIDPADYEETED